MKRSQSQACVRAPVSLTRSSVPAVSLSHCPWAAICLSRFVSTTERKRNSWPKPLSDSSLCSDSAHSLFFYTSIAQRGTGQVISCCKDPAYTLSFDIALPYTSAFFSILLRKRRHFSERSSDSSSAASENETGQEYQPAQPGSTLPLPDRDAYLGEECTVCYETLCSMSFPVNMPVWGFIYGEYLLERAEGGSRICTASRASVLELP